MLNKLLTSFFLVFLIIYCIFKVIVFENLFSFDIEAEYVVLIVLMGLNQVVYNINKNTFNPLSPDLIFYFLFILFHFGYILLFYFGIYETYDEEIFYNISSFTKSIYFLIACLGSFLLGYNLFFNKIGKFNFNKSFFDLKAVDRIYFLSKIFIILSLIMFWVPIISVGPIIFYDYSLVNRIGELSSFGKFFWVGQIFSIFSISIYYISKFSLNKSFINDYFSILPLIYVLGFFVIGQRAYVLYYLVVIMTAYQFFYKKIHFPKLILMSSLILFVSGVLAVSRVESVYNPIEAYLLYASNKENNPIVGSIAEFGSTFKTIPIIMTYIPDYYEHLNGKTFYDSLKIALPNFGSARESSNLASWLTSTAFGDNTWGRGGSIAMEAYGNFGIMGSQFFFVFLGCIIATAYNRFYENKKFYHVLFYFLILAAVCLWMRNTSTFVFRILLWGILAYVFCLFVCRLNIWKSSK